VLSSLALILLTRGVEVQVDFLAPKFRDPESDPTLSEFPPRASYRKASHMESLSKSFVEAISLDAHQFLFG
jgi:hypothetical protein